MNEELKPEIWSLSKNTRDGEPSPSGLLVDRADDSPDDAGVVVASCFHCTLLRGTRRLGWNFGIRCPDCVRSDASCSVSCSC